MDNPFAKVVDLILGNWRSQILHAGVKLGVFDALAGGPRSAASVATELEVDAGMLYRLMRALGSLELLKEDNTRTFSLTPMSEFLRRDHPHPLRAMTLLHQGPVGYGMWKHLPDIVKDGGPSGYVREFGLTPWEYMAQNPSQREVFNEAMSSYSIMDNAAVLEALQNYDFSGISHLCDVGGGHGRTLCLLLAKHPHLKGTVLELPSVIENKELLWADKLGVGNRYTYVPGDMFREIPPADAYMVKRVIHDWNDEECIQILSNMHRAAPQNGRVFIMEYVVPGADTPHFSKLIDILMMVGGGGRERTLEEHTGLLEGAGWKYRQTWYPSAKILGVVEGVKA